MTPFSDDGKKWKKVLVMFPDFKTESKIFTFSTISAKKKLLLQLNTDNDEN